MRVPSEETERIYMLLARNGIVRPRVTHDLTDYAALPTDSTRWALGFSLDQRQQRRASR